MHLLSIFVCCLQSVKNKKKVSVIQLKIRSFLLENLPVSRLQVLETRHCEHPLTMQMMPEFVDVACLLAKRCWIDSGYLSSILDLLLSVVYQL